MAQSSSDHPSNAQGRGEDEPLLGRVGDASLQEGKPLIHNLVLGTAFIAQAGIWIQAATIWAAVFNHPEALGLFSAHPLLNSAALVFTTQAILILQPTHTSAQKINGTHLHALLNSTAFLALLVAFIVIEYTKFSHNVTHFDSVHGKLGLITYILFFLQTIVGLTQFYLPDVYGGVENAKMVYKYHRMSGYVGLVLGLATVSAATQTFTGEETLGIRLWAMIVTGVLVVVGVLPRIRKQKLGL